MYILDIHILSVLTENVFLISPNSFHFLEGLFNAIMIHIANVLEYVLQRVLYPDSHAYLTTNENITSVP